MTIGVLLDDLHNPFYADVADGLIAAAAERGYRILFTSGMRHVATEKIAVDTLLELHADGVVLVSPRFGASQIERFAAYVPLVSVGVAMRPSNFDVVNVDEAAGTRAMLDLFVELGHSRIAHVDGGKGAGHASGGRPTSSSSPTTASNRT